MLDGSDGPTAMKSQAVVVFSGGQDSTTALFWALDQFEEVLAISFQYGQRHAVELQQAERIAQKAGTPWRLIDLRGLLGDSALTDSSRDIDAKHPRNTSLPASFVPGRNLLFLSVAGSYAYSHGIEDLVAGMCQADYSGYPDCRRSFIDVAEEALSAAMEPARFRIHTPIMDLDKGDTFKLASDLGVLDLILEETHTDYNGDRSMRHPWGYGQLDNEASRLRARGWDDFCQRYPDLVPPE
jgi:7-cyano-7-deazaguanine synthase